MDNSNDDQSASEQIITVFRDEFRVTPLLLRERTGLRKQRVNRVLNRLRAEGRIVKITKGLYEIDENSYGEENQKGQDGERGNRHGRTTERCPSMEINPDDLEFGDSRKF